MGVNFYFPFAQAKRKHGILVKHEVWCSFTMEENTYLYLLIHVLYILHTIYSFSFSTFLLLLL